MTGGTHRRQQIFVVTQVAACFVLLAGASMLLKTLLSLQNAQTGFDTHRVLALNMPKMTLGRTDDQILGFQKEVMRRTGELPGVDSVAMGWAVPWRDARTFGLNFQFSTEGRLRGAGGGRSARADAPDLARIFHNAGGSYP